MVEDLDIEFLSLPIGVTLPLLLLMLLPVIWACMKLRDRAASFVIVACWLRYVLGTLHEYSFRMSPIGMSYNAIVSLAVFGTGLLIVQRRGLLLKVLAPMYILLGIAVVSGLVNADIAKLVVVISKFGYFTVITLCMYEAMQRLGDRFPPYLLIAFLPPFVFQIFSIALNVPRSRDPDGALSFIGGYNHEAAFSIVMATALLVVCLARGMPLIVRVGAFVAAFAGLMIADYRTTIVAFLPFLLVAALTGPGSLFKPAQRALVILSGAVLLFGVGIATRDKVAERFADLAAVGQIGDYLTRSPDQFNRQEQQLMSARLYLWARYLQTWRDGPPHYRLIGAGPEARIPTKDKYPHNTFISTVYEYGLLGLAVYFLLFGMMAAQSLQAPPGDRARLVAAHLSFFILNMSTMPMWQIEGNILYGLMCGYTLYAARLGRMRRAGERQPAIAYATPRPLAA